MNLSDSSGRFRRAQRLPKDIECPSPVFGLDVGLNPTLLRLPLAPECLGNREVEAGAVAPALGGGTDICSGPQSRLRFRAFVDRSPSEDSKIRLGLRACQDIARAVCVGRVCGRVPFFFLHRKHGISRGKPRHCLFSKLLSMDPAATEVEASCAAGNEMGLEDDLAQLL